MTLQISRRDEIQNYRSMMQMKSFRYFLRLTSQRILKFYQEFFLSPSFLSRVSVRSSSRGRYRIVFRLIRHYEKNVKVARTYIPQLISRPRRARISIERYRAIFLALARFRNRAVNSTLFAQLGRDYLKVAIVCKLEI